MKKVMKPIVALSVLLTTLNAVIPCRAAERTPGAPAPTTAPVVVATKTALSPQQIAHYRQQAAQSRNVTNRKAAGASSNTALWIVGGVVVVAGAIALASGGGGGGGGGGY